MKKKIAAILSMFMILSSMCFTFTGCAENVYKEYKAAFDKTNSLSDCDMSGNLTVSMKMPGTETTIPMKIEMKMKDVNTTNPIVLGDIQMSMLGMNINSKVYYADGYEYISTGDSKIKQKVSLEEFMNNSGDFDNMVELPEEVLKDISFTKEDGNKKLAVTCDGALLKDQLLKSASNIESLVGKGISLDDVTFSDVAIELTINKDGYISNYKFSCDMTLMMDLMGSGNKTESTVGLDSDITYNNPGSSVTFEAPTDLNEYYEANLLGK